MLETKNMKKSIIFGALAAAGMMAAPAANAALATDALLGVDAGVGSCEVSGTYPSCTYGATTVNTGSYFAMDTNADGFTNNERVVINAPGTDGGITLTGAQTGHGIDGPTEGSVDGDGNPIGTPLTPGQIDGGWDFFGAHGWHTTSAAPAIASDDGAGNVTLSMTGWTVHWNGGNIDMGLGANAIMTCAVDCSSGDTYVLDYAATVPTGSFANVNYQLHLEGTISTAVIPVPAAVWLFGSGLLGLVGIARRRKAA